METKREDYIDIAKGLCMLVVICIHTELFHNIGFNWTNFAVPMFFFMSGFFDKNSLPFIAFIKKYTHYCPVKMDKSVFETIEL